MFPARIVIGTHLFQEALVNNSHSFSGDGIYLYHTVVTLKQAPKFSDTPLFKEWSLISLFY